MWLRDKYILEGSTGAHVDADGKQVFFFSGPGEISGPVSDCGETEVTTVVS